MVSQALCIFLQHVTNISADNWQSEREEKEEHLKISNIIQAQPKPEAICTKQPKPAKLPIVKIYGLY